MSRIAYCADPHIWSHKQFGGSLQGGLNRRASECLAVLRRAIQVAADEDCGGFVVLGDVFDGPRPEPPLLAAVQQELVACRGLGMEPVLLVGNHDRASSAPGDHALAPLAPVATVVEEPGIVEVAGSRILCWPYMPGRSLLQGWQPELEAVVRLSGGIDALAMHMGIADGGTPPWLAGKGIHVDELRRIMGDLAIERCYAGDWHSYREFEYGIVQVGTLCPAGFDDSGLGYGFLFTEEPDDWVSQHTIPGPRFVKDLFDAQVVLSGRRYSVYVKESCPPEEYELRRVALEAMQHSGQIAGYVLEPDDAVAVAQARTAAGAARAATSLAEALDGYVAAMPLDEAQDRQKVLERCRRYLGL